MAPFYGWGSTVLRLQSQFEEIVCFLPLSPQAILVLISSTLKGRKAESTLEPPSGFKHGTSGPFSKSNFTFSIQVVFVGKTDVSLDSSESFSNDCFIN